MECSEIRNNGCRKLSTRQPASTLPTPLDPEPRTPISVLIELYDNKKTSITGGYRRAFLLTEKLRETFIEVIRAVSKGTFSLNMSRKIVKVVQKKIDKVWFSEVAYLQLLW